MIRIFITKLFIVLLVCLPAFLFSQNKESLQSAKEIIDLVIQNKSKNSSKQKFNSFEYINYNKVIFSAFDSIISDKIDYVLDYRIKSFLKNRADSTRYKFKQEIKDKHFFIAEKISKLQVRKKRQKETILSVKMAGFKEPIYEFITLGVSNIDYYNNQINLFGTSYVSPLANNARKHYLFFIEKETDTNYVVRFKSQKRKKSVGLEGYLFIDKNSFALTKVTTKINGKINVQLTQHFVFLEIHQHWFIGNTSIILTKGTSKTNLNVFRKLLGLRPKYSVSKFNPEDVSFIKVESKNDSIKINKSVNISLNDYDIVIDKKATNRKSSYWDNNIETIEKEKRTYSFLDSIVEKHRIERKINVLRKFRNGYFSTKFLDIDLGQVSDFNNHEGIRVGLGGVSNDYLSSRFRINGYTAYGTKDKKLKHRYGIEFLARKKSNTWIGINQTNDLYEASNPKLLFDDSNFVLINPRKTNVSLFYQYKTSEINLNHEFAPYFITKTQFSTGEYENLFDYTYISRTKLLHNYTLTNLIFAFEWSPFSKYMMTPRGKFSVKKAFPNINAEITKSFDNILNGDFSYTQIHLKVNHEIQTIKSGSTQLLLKAGVLFGEAPFSHLYNHGSNHTLSNPWRSRINISGTDTFETMLFNEFISDTYVALQVRQNFEKFRIGKNFKPKLSIVTRFTIGTIKNPLNHQGVHFKTLQKGYIESGIVLNKILYGFGLSSFYRYGPQKFEKAKDNIAVKITYTLGFL